MYCIKELAFVPPPYGGASIYIKRLIERMNELGFVTGGYYLPQCKDMPVRESELFHEWKWLPTHLFIPYIFKYVRETRPYKIVHSHFGLEGMLYLWTLKMFCGKKIVITIHNSMVKELMKSSNFINSFFLRRMTKSPEVTWIAVSEQTKAYLLELPLAFGSDIQVIPAYIPLINNGENGLSVDLMQYINNHEKIIVFYGHSFMKYAEKDVYGFTTTLKMYGAFSKEEQKRYGMVFCIANSSDKELLSLKELAKSLEIDNSIYWQIGAIDNMAALWDHTDVYVRPTCTDGDSVAVREALDMGANVVASDVCSRPNDAIIYHFDDEMNFLDSVKKALSIGKRMRNTDETYFNQMLGVYKRLLE